MKNHEKILIILSLLILSCNRTDKKQKLNTEITKKNISDSEIIRDTIKFHQIKQEISGTFYTERLRPEKGFYLKNNKPKNNFILYKLVFKDGLIEFEDLTEFYDCGNGIFSLNNSKYTKNDTGNYIIEFNGEYALEASFKIKGEYKLTETNNGVKYLFPIKIFENKQEPIYFD
ncbi:hypothetical protein Q4595_16160 [Wenyingzhuangia sp. 1_MG-2023]|nr:hypothetical protein [Wenyingzhuangia sp. 1_MG-2023]